MDADTGHSTEASRSENPGGSLVFAGGELAGLIHPVTGELVPRDAGPAELAGWLEAMAAWIEQAQDAVRVAEALVLERMDREAVWTVHTPAGTLEAPAPGGAEYDRDRLGQVLRRLVAEGWITPEAAERCWTAPRPPQPRPSKRGLAAIAKVPRVAAELERAEAPARRRRVKLNGRVVG